MWAANSLAAWLLTCGTNWIVACSKEAASQAAPWLPPAGIAYDKTYQRISKHTQKAEGMVKFHGPLLRIEEEALMGDVMLNTTAKLHQESVEHERQARSEQPSCKVKEFTMIHRMAEKDLSWQDAIHHNIPEVSGELGRYTFCTFERNSNGRKGSIYDQYFNV